MDDKCQKCGRGIDEVATLFSDSFPGFLPGIWCWECYHKEAIRQSKPCFQLLFISANSGYTDRHCCEDAITDAVIETEDNIDQGIGITAPIDGSYMSAFIVRNGQLYVRYADLRGVSFLSDEDRLKYLGSLLKEMDFIVRQPIIEFGDFDEL